MEAAAVRVDLGERSYDVWVGEGLLEKASGFIPAPKGSAVAVITDENVGELYLETLERGLDPLDLEVLVESVAPGEGSKDASVAVGLLERFARRGLKRSDMVVALGGGVVGDLAGFVASVYGRGMRVVQVPTTLMAQVDSSIGGKTAVNLPQAKNLVGTFHQPAAVICDVALLATLPTGVFRSGLAEVAKYGFLDPEGPAASWKGRADDKADAAVAVRSCAAAKAGFVVEDEFDMKGVRAFLNYGHTLGHALEAAGGYATYTHGEAVAIGMVYAAIVSEEAGIAAEGLSGRHRERLSGLGLPVKPAEPRPAFLELLGPMSLDKKVTRGLTMVLLEAEGRPRIEAGLDRDMLALCYERLLGEA